MTSPIALPASAPAAYAPPPRDAAASTPPDAKTETAAAAFRQVLAAAAAGEEHTDVAGIEETPEPEPHKEESDIVAAPWTPVAIVRDPRTFFGWQTPAASGGQRAVTVTTATPAGRPESALAEAPLDQPVEAALEGVAVEAAEGDATAAGETAFALRTAPAEAPRIETPRPTGQQQPLPDKAAAATPAAHKPEPKQNNDSGSSHKDSNSQNRQPARPAAQSARPASAAPAAEEAAPTHPVHADAATPNAPVAAARSFSVEMDAQAPRAEAAAPAAPTPAVSEADDLAPAPKAVQQISLRVAGEDNQRVELRVMERAGEIRLTVRSADETLTREMRGNLAELSHKLSEGGLRAETWQPARSDSAAFSDPQDATRQNDSGRQPRQQRQPGQPPQQQQSQDERRQRPAWLEEFEQWR